LKTYAEKVQFPASYLSLPFARKPIKRSALLAGAGQR